MIAEKITHSATALRNLAAQLDGVEREAAKRVAAVLLRCADATRVLESLPLPITEPDEYTIQ